MALQFEAPHDDPRLAGSHALRSGLHQQQGICQKFAGNSHYQAISQRMAAHWQEMIN